MIYESFISVSLLSVLVYQEFLDQERECVTDLTSLVELDKEN